MLEIWPERLGEEVKARFVVVFVGMRPLDVGKDNGQTCLANDAADLGERQELSWAAEGGQQDVQNLRR